MNEAKNNRSSENRPSKGADPSEEPGFRKVVDYFLRTKPKPKEGEKTKKPEGAGGSS